MTSPARGTLPYGPATAPIRRFFVALAALEIEPHDAVVRRFASQSESSAFLAADATLGEIIERSGRTDARDALFGPLLQLVRDRDVAEQAVAEDAVADEAVADEAVAEANTPVPLDPIAEPALAALMALLVHDLLSAATLATLYAAFAEAIPLDSVLA